MVPRRGPHTEVPPLGENLVDTVAHVKMGTQATSAPIDTTPLESIPSSGTAPSSSPSSPSPALVLVARVQKLEALIATLLHHIKPFMQRSIVEAEESLERKIAQHIERNIAEVHQSLNAFKLRVLARLASPVDVSTLQDVVESL